MGMLQKAERSMVRARCGVQLNDRTRSMDLMFSLGLNETINQLAMANSVENSVIAIHVHNGKTNACHT